MVRMARTHAITTPKSCQDRKVAAIRDACDRRGLRAFSVFKVQFLKCDFQSLCRLSNWHSGLSPLFGAVIEVAGWADLSLC